LEAITWVGQNPTWVVAPGSEWVSEWVRVIYKVTHLRYTTCAWIIFLMKCMSIY
jgi:hypothetical protein